MARRQASLGTLVPRTPTVAPGPKARAELALGEALVEDEVPRAPKRLRARLARDGWMGRERLCSPRHLGNRVPS